MNLDRIVELTQELVSARGPCGQEQEVRDIVLREMRKTCDKVWVDEAENAVGLIRGKPARGKRGGRAPIIRVFAHLDEIALIVKRLEPDGRLRVQPLGGIRPWILGLGPVEIMAEGGILPGVLSVGPVHTTAETPAMWRSKELGEAKTPEWPQVYVFTRMGVAELAAAGVRPGTRVVVPRDRRGLVAVGDCLAGYFLDDRACLAVMLAAAAELRAGKGRPPADVYLVGTSGEEIGAGSACFASASLPGTVSLAVDVGPVAAEYGTRLTRDPIIGYRDKHTVYTRSVCDRLAAVARGLGLDPQCAALENYGSDASIARKTGNAPKAGLLGVPTENTHGFEIVPREALAECARVLAGYLREPV